MARPARFERETGPVEEVVLAPGDLVYVPGGTWHEMVALEDSLSISLGLEAPTFLEVLDDLRRELTRGVRWRERLPVLGRASGLDDAGRLAAAREILEAVARGVVEHLTEEDRASRWLAQALAASLRSSTVR
jgi:ribosomal protein L16 Arg81 hydroxylase